MKVKAFFYRKMGETDDKDQGQPNKIIPVGFFA